jgi:hypothetical protein
MITPNSSHDYTPFEIVFGKKFTLPKLKSGTAMPIYDLDNYVKEIRNRLDIAQARTAEFLNKEKLKRKELFDRSLENKLKYNFKVGDKIKINFSNRNKIDPFSFFFFFWVVEG